MKEKLDKTEENWSKLNKLKIGTELKIEQNWKLDKIESWTKLKDWTKLRIGQNWKIGPNWTIGQITIFEEVLENVFWIFGQIKLFGCSVYSKST